MSPLIITMTTTQGLTVGFTFIAVGAFIQYWIRLELDDRADAKATAEETEEDQALAITRPVDMTQVHIHVDRRIPQQRDGGSGHLTRSDR